MVFYVVLDVLFLFVFFTPILYNNYFWLNPNQQDFELASYFFLYFIVTLKLSLIFMFFMKSIYHNRIGKNFFLNFLVLNFLILTASGIINFFLEKKILKNFYQNYFHTGLFLANAFHFLVFVIFSISNRIVRLRNQKIIRRLNTSKYEFEKLYDFIKQIQEDFVKKVSFFKYYRIAEFTTTYIVEQNATILASLSFFDSKDFVLIYDAFFINHQDFQSLFYALLKKIFAGNEFVIIIPSSLYDRQKFLELFYAASMYIPRSHWQVEGDTAAIRKLFEDKMKNHENYFVREFFHNYLDFREAVFITKIKDYN